MSGYLRDSQLRRQLEERVKETTRTRQAAEDGLKAAEDVIEAARKIDANVVEAEKVLADASAAMAEKDYKLAAERAAEATERGKRIYRERAAAMIESSASLVGLARGVGADVGEAEGSLTKAREALDAEDMSEAVDAARKAWKRSEKVLSEHLSSSFSKVQALILSAKNLGRDVAPVEDLLSRARTAVEGNNFASALDFTKEGLETITEDLTSAVDKDLRDDEDLLHAAQELGADGVTFPSTPASMPSSKSRVTSSPSAAITFTPLNSGGLCEAVMITPSCADQRGTRNWIAGVGRRPTSITR